MTGVLPVLSMVEIKMVVGYMATKGYQKTPLKIEDHPIPEFLYKYCKLDA
jgi:hypothetical protein